MLRNWSLPGTSINGNGQEAMFAGSGLLRKLMNTRDFMERNIIENNKLRNFAQLLRWLFRWGCIVSFRKSRRLIAFHTLCPLRRQQTKLIWERWLSVLLDLRRLRHAYWQLSRAVSRRRLKLALSWWESSRRHSCAKACHHREKGIRLMNQIWDSWYAWRRVISRCRKILQKRELISLQEALLSWIMFSFQQLLQRHHTGSNLSSLSYRIDECNGRFLMQSFRGWYRKVTIDRSKLSKSKISAMKTLMQYNKSVLTVSWKMWVDLLFAKGRSIVANAAATKERHHQTGLSKAWRFWNDHIFSCLKSQRLECRMISKVVLLRLAACIRPWLQFVKHKSLLSKHFRLVNVKMRLRYLNFSWTEWMFTVIAVSSHQEACTESRINTFRQKNRFLLYASQVCRRHLDRSSFMLLNHQKMELIKGVYCAWMRILNRTKEIETILHESDLRAEIFMKPYQGNQTMIPIALGLTMSTWALKCFLGALPCYIRTWRKFDNTRRTQKLQDVVWILSHKRNLRATDLIRNRRRLNFLFNIMTSWSQITFNQKKEVYERVRSHLVLRKRCFWQWVSYNYSFRVMRSMASIFARGTNMAKCNISFHIWLHYLWKQKRLAVTSGRIAVRKLKMARHWLDQFTQTIMSSWLLVAKYKRHTSVIYLKSQNRAQRRMLLKALLRWLDRSTCNKQIVCKWVNARNRKSLASIEMSFDRWHFLFMEQKKSSKRSAILSMMESITCQSLCAKQRSLNLPLESKSDTTLSTKIDTAVM